MRRLDGLRLEGGVLRCERAHHDAQLGQASQSQEAWRACRFGPRGVVFARGVFVIAPSAREEK